MDSKRVIAACRRAWGDGVLQKLTGGERGYQWYCRESGNTHWLAYSLKEAYAAAVRAQPIGDSPGDSR